MTTGYRDATSWADRLSDPEHLAALCSLPPDFEPIAELERWARGIPDHELDEARALWTAWLGDPVRGPALVRLSIQIGGELGPTERYTMYARAADACPEPTSRTALAANAASTALRIGDLDGARRWLSECTVCTNSLLADSALRIASASLALTEGRPHEAVRLLGNDGVGVPILRSYGPLASALRAHALAASGDSAASERALDGLIATAGVTEAKAIIKRLPPSWNVDTSHFDQLWRRSEASSARFRIAGGVFCVLAAIGTAIGANADIQAGVSDGDAWLALLNPTPVLFVFAGWLLVTGRRQLRIARDGILGDARVVTKVYRRSSRNGHSRYGLGLEADVRDSAGREHHVAATSLSSFDPGRADAYLDERVRVLWHPAYPHVALVSDVIR